MLILRRKTILYNTVLFIDKVNCRKYTYYTKDYVTACTFRSQMKIELKFWVDGKDYDIIQASEIELSDNFIENKCINIQPGVYLLLY